MARHRVTWGRMLWPAVSLCPFSLQASLWSQSPVFSPGTRHIGLPPPLFLLVSPSQQKGTLHVWGLGTHCSIGDLWEQPLWKRGEGTGLETSTLAGTGALKLFAGGAGGHFQRLKPTAHSPTIGLASQCLEENPGVSRSP